MCSRTQEHKWLSMYSKNLRFTLIWHEHVLQMSHLHFTNQQQHYPYQCLNIGHHVSSQSLKPHSSRPFFVHAFNLKQITPTYTKVSPAKTLGFFSYKVQNLLYYLCSCGEFINYSKSDGRKEDVWKCQK